MTKLPVPKKKKKFNLKRFINIANKVKKSLEEEEEYLRKHGKIYEDSKTGRFYIDY